MYRNCCLCYVKVCWRKKRNTNAVRSDNNPETYNHSPTPYHSHVLTQITRYFNNDQRVHLVFGIHAYDWWSVRWILTDLMILTLFNNAIIKSLLNVIFLFWTICRVDKYLETIKKWFMTFGLNFEHEIWKTCNITNWIVQNSEQSVLKKVYICILVEIYNC